MKFQLIFLLIFIVSCSAIKNFEQRKAQLTKELNKEIGNIYSRSSWESREKRKMRRMGYDQYCAYYPNRYPCRRQNQYRDPYRYPYYYYQTTTALPFPFNLFGKK